MELTKLIDELFYKTILQVRTGSTESAKKVFETGIEQILASRPTCGVEQRKFLDEVEANWYYDEDNDFIANTDQGQESNIFADEMESVDLRKVIRGD